LSFCTFSFGHCVVCSSSIYGVWLTVRIFKLFLRQMKVDEGCSVFENRFSYHIIFVSFNSNWSFWWRPSFHSFVLCVVCDAQDLVFCIVYCILIKIRYFTWSPLLICCGMRDSGKPHYGSHASALMSWIYNDMINTVRSLFSQLHSSLPAM
jgi:hypothetical protein